MSFTLAVDAMGGDLGPRVAFQAVRSALATHSDLNVQFYIQHAESTWLEAELPINRLHIVYSEQSVLMTDKPSHALRRKRSSSMALALGAVATGEAQACVSVGNSGALMALARFILSTHIDVDRPAMATEIPTSQQPFLMLDLGANIDAGADMLLQFAVLGASWRKAQGLACPRIGLLNIGKEASKGTEEIRLASQLIAELDGIDYIGFVEADELYQGHVDVVVCDGFNGNIALKTSEGLLAFVDRQLLQAFQKNIVTRLLKRLVWPIVEDYRQSLNPVMHSGALLLGLNGLVVKSHGKSSAEEFYQAIDYALRQVQGDVSPQLSLMIDELSK